MSSNELNFYSGQVEVFLVKVPITDVCHALDLLSKPENFIQVQTNVCQLVRETSNEDLGYVTLNKCVLIRGVGSAPTITSIGHTVISMRMFFEGTDRDGWSLILKGTLDTKDAKKTTLISYLSDCNLISYQNTCHNCLGRIGEEELTVIGALLAPWTPVDHLLATNPA